VDPEGLRSFIRRVDRGLAESEPDAANLDALIQVARAVVHRLEGEAAERAAAIDRALDGDAGSVPKLTRERRMAQRQLEAIQSRLRRLDARANDLRPNRG
jgi:hypothetical protein